MDTISLLFILDKAIAMLEIGDMDEYCHSYGSPISKGKCESWDVAY